MPFRIVACTFSDNLSRNSFKLRLRCLLRERLSEKVHATILKGIVGGLSSMFFKEIWKNWYERPWKSVYTLPITKLCQTIVFFTFIPTFTAVHFLLLHSFSIVFILHSFNLRKMSSWDWIWNRSKGREDDLYHPVVTEFNSKVFTISSKNLTQLQ